MMKFQPEKGANSRSSIKSIVCRFFSATPSEARGPYRYQYIFGDMNQPV
jgi:hypothetical protein